MRKKISLKDIATELGVSTAVVSYVLNDKHKGKISETKAEQIKDLAKKLNYFPNQIAKSLRKDRTLTIGVIIADISNLFYSNIVRYIEDESKRHSYNVIFGSMDENADKFKELIQVMLSRQVDGLILAAPKDTYDTLGYLRGQNIPFVLIDRYFPRINDINTVAIDNYQASYAVVEHIAENGYKKPAMVTLSTDLYHMKERTSGFRKACMELLGIKEPKVVEIKEDVLSDETEHRMLSLLKEGIDLVYFSTNKVAMEGLAVLVKHDIHVPNEMGIVCFDEADAYKIFNTSITFVKQPLQVIGRESVEVLISLINGNHSAKNIVLGTQIVANNSSAPRKKAETAKMIEPMKLNAENLAALPADICVPTYRRCEVKAGIVHIGIGGFHRAHQAYFIDQLLAQGMATGWGICGVALLASDREIYDVLSKQDGLYTLMTPDADGNFSARVIGSIVELLYAPENPSAVVHKMADESIRVITLTITEGGYNLTSDGSFNWDNGDVLWDLQHPDQPKTVFGYLYAALKRRREQGLSGLTIQSCDNIEHNGDVIRRMLHSFITKAEPEMINWLNEHVTFPNSMVDRITPATTDSLRTMLVENFGLNDGWPVVCESFYQWIIEDSFAAGRPKWEKVGVQLVAGVMPYEKMKIRLLNGGHTLVGLAGYLLGYRYIHESIENPAIANLLRMYMDEEVTSTLDEVPGVNLDEYKDMLVERFRSPFIKDEVARIISGSSAKFPKFILPVILDQLRGRRSVRIAALIAACWYQYLRLNLSVPANIRDERATVLLLDISRAEQEQNPLLFLDNPEVFGNIKEQRAFTESFLLHINALDSTGIKSVIEREWNEN